MMGDVTLAKARIAGAILAGGQAVRSGGRPKGLLEAVSGLAIIEQEIRQLNLAGIDEVIIVASDPQPWCDCALKVVLDLRSGVEPLAGIEAALAYYGSSYDATLFLPCDLPGITTSEISQLLAAFTNNSAPVAVAVTRDFFCEPLCAVVHNNLTQASQAGYCRRRAAPPEAMARCRSDRSPLRRCDPLLQYQHTPGYGPVAGEDGVNLMRGTLGIPETMLEPIANFIKAIRPRHRSPMPRRRSWSTNHVLTCRHWPAACIQVDTAGVRLDAAGPG